MTIDLRLKTAPQKRKSTFLGKTIGPIRRHIYDGSGDECVADGPRPVADEAL